VPSTVRPVIATNCEFGQGYPFSRPRSGAKVELLLSGGNGQLPAAD
jgi:EAL domain-containing protein (putative c-di-GMP-specific phosphodiesterase class I)